MRTAVPIFDFDDRIHEDGLLALHVKETADQFFARLKQKVSQRNHKEAKSHVVYH